MAEYLTASHESESSKGPYDKGDAAKDTNSSRQDVDHAWHDARTDAEDSGDLDRGSESGSGGYGGSGTESTGTHSDDN